MIPFNTAKAAEYVGEQLDKGKLKPSHIVEMVAFWQEHHGLEVDGAPGPKTIASVNAQIVERQKAGVAAMRKAWPLRVLADGRKPEVTSRYKDVNPDRPKHNGIDLFYRYDASKDGPVKIGDGGASRGPDGKPKWFIPDREPARAAADGEVSRASKIATGFRVAIVHDDGHETIYCHLRNLAVVVGQRVAIGDPVGEVGDNPADVDAEHLHFEVHRLGGDSVDPELWLKGAEYL